VAAAVGGHDAVVGDPLDRRVRECEQLRRQRGGEVEVHRRAVEEERGAFIGSGDGAEPLAQQLLVVGSPARPCLPCHPSCCWLLHRRCYPRWPWWGGAGCCWVPWGKAVVRRSWLLLGCKEKERCRAWLLLGARQWLCPHTRNPSVHQ
jgi:hypothetical protein